METTPFLEGLSADLAAATAGDHAASAVAERISRTLESSIQLRLLDAIGQAAVELSDQLPSGHVEVRLSGRDVQLVYATEDRDIAPAPGDEDGGTARLTLRMPETMKTRLEQAASREGVSTNAWLVRAVSRGLEQRRRATRNRVTGFAQS